MSGPGQAKTIAELRSLSDEELIKQHDALVANTVAGTGFYLGELRRRESARQERRMTRLTWVITALTGVNLAAVVVIALTA
jgi:hypothetical protein